MTCAHVWLAIDFGEHGWLAVHSALAAWIAGIFQAVGAIGTLWAVIVALGGERKAQARRVKVAEDEEQDRLRLLTVFDSSGGSVGPVIEVNIRNDGQEAILIVGVTDVQPRPDGSSVISRHAGRTNAGHPSAGPIPFQGEALFDVQCVDTEGQPVAYPEGLKEITIEFKDARGKAWSRINNREPEPIEMVLWERERLGTARKRPRRGTKEWRKANRWWNPYREKPSLSWWGRRKSWIRTRAHKINLWALGWERRILLGDDMSKQRPPDY